MSDNAFTLQKVREAFHVQFDPTPFLFSDLSPVPLSETMQRYFAEYRTLGMAMPNEKGKSEFLVSSLRSRLTGGEIPKMIGRLPNSFLHESSRFVCSTRLAPHSSWPRWRA